jgi:hypothetical protein
MGTKQIPKIFHSPTKKPSPMLHQKLQNEGLGEHVSRLLLGVNLVEGEGCPFSLRPMQPMEVFHIDVLGAWTGLGDLGNGQGTIGVFKNMTMDGVLVGDNRKSQLLHLSIRVRWIGMMALVAVARAMNSASVLDKAISVCIWDFQNKGTPP